VDRASVS